MVAAVCVLVVLVMTSACGGRGDSAAGDRTGTTGTPAADHPSWDAVVQARSAMVVSYDDPARGSSQAVELSDVDPRVTLFADRPTRLAGEMGVEELLALWHGGAFGSDPPNAAVVVDGSTTAVELDTALYDPANRRIAFTIHRLDDVDGAPGLPLPIGAHGRTILFVDAFSDPASSPADAVAAPDVKVLGEAPGRPMGQLYQTVGRSLGLASLNASAPTSMYDPQATTNQSVSLLYSIVTTACPPSQWCSPLRPFSLPGG